VPGSSRSGNTVLAGAAGAQVAAAFVNFGLPAVGARLRTDFGLSLLELGAVLTAGLLGSGLSLIAAGIAVDRYGTRRAMIVGTTLGTAGLVVAAHASSVPLLFAALFVFGVGTAVVPVAGAGELFRAFGPGRRGWALGVRQTAVPLGGTIAAVAFPLLYAIGGLTLTLLVSAVAVAVTGVAFALIAEGGHPSGVRTVDRPFRSIWRAPGMQRLLLVAACYIVVLQALLSYTVPAVRAAGYSELTASIAYVSINVTAMVARIVWGRIADAGAGTRRGRTLVEVGLVASGGALLFAFALHVGPAMIVAAAALFGVGALGWNALVYVSAGERASPELAARSVAVAATVVFVLAGVITPLLGAIADVVGWDGLWVSAAAVAGLGALLAARLGPTALPGAPPPVSSRPTSR
jgi:MFS family permease